MFGNRQRASPGPVRVIVMEHKFCRRCEKVLPLDAFNRNKSNPDGLQDWCRPCQKIWYATHRDDAVEKMRQYHATRKQEAV